MARSFGRLNQSASNITSEELRSGETKTMFFQEGVKWVTPREKKPLIGRILPARDPNMSEMDSAWRTSFFPYRDKNVIDEKVECNLGNPVYTGFFAIAQGYRFLGDQGWSFLSPLTLRHYGSFTPEETACPVNDLYGAAKKDDKYEYLVEKTKEEGQRFESAKLPSRPKALVLFNWYGLDSFTNKQEVSVLISNSMALDALRTELAKYRNPSLPPLDPEWDQFMLGDVTHPKTGLQSKVVSLPSPTGGQSFLGFKFSEGPNAAGAMQAPVDDTILAQRYDLISDKVLRIESYQAIVDMLKADGMFPKELLKVACGHMAVIGGTDALGTPAEQTASPEPTQAATPPELADPIPMEHHTPMPPAATLPSGRFWVAPKGQSTMPTPQTADKVFEMLQEGQEMNLMPESDTAAGWKSPKEFGFRLPEPPAPPPAPEIPPAPPAAPEAPPAPPAAPEAPAAPTAPAAQQELIGMPASAEDTWTPEDQQAMDKLLAKAKTPGMSLQQDETKVLMTLKKKQMACGVQ